MIQIHADPDVEAALVELINRTPVKVGTESIRIVVVQQVTSGGLVATPTTGASPSAQRLTLQDYVLNVLTRAERALSTREVTHQVQQLRAVPTNQNSIYNTLRNAKLEKLVKRDGDNWTATRT